MRSDILLFPMIIIWFTALIHIIDSSGLDISLFYKVLSYIIIGTIIISGRVFLDVLIRSGTIYALTKERFYIIHDWPFYWSKSVLIQDLSSYSVSYSLNNKIIIDLGRNLRDPWPATGWSAWLPSLSRRWRVLGISDKEGFIEVLEKARIDRPD